ncbi:ATP-binding cassette domain-containing protein [Duncaniella freteri]|jgi:cell division transport system ATP-binding protein|uniref:ATP-binding cassette domain-containing protein n=2 Tax=Duncaniella TaxID=2518495 RepID=A0A4Z0V7Y5_9BACT|nr:ATP-binding cassette domain-containing protein [Duncaniella freteri]MDE7026326.1 ATP-binding cassette domain-containing protein [Duncaniella freteri]TGG40504.1 ATP-binding cassette domain-containing protein [Duncaniella freteri]
MPNVIDYRDVTIHRNSLITLKHIDLKVGQGEFVYIIGKVGSGKSSLLKSFYADVPVASGSARVLDYDLSSIRSRDIPYLRRQIGIVFQDFRLLTDRSAEDNLRFVLRATGWTDRAEIDERISDVLKSVGMENKKYKKPHELSGGEQQRIVIARALLNKPPLILADEPTGNLDPSTGESIVSYLHTVAREGTTVIMATHNMSLVEQFPARTLICSQRTLR